MLSLTAKVYLGTFLLINVIMVDGGAEAALANGGVLRTIAGAPAALLVPTRARGGSMSDPPVVLEEVPPPPSLPY